MSTTEKIDHAKDLIRDALAKYPSVRLACSWGKDSMVVLHLALQVDPGISVFSVMPPTKPAETFRYKEKMAALWNVNLEVYGEDNPVHPTLHLTDPHGCCNALKVLPTMEALEGVDCWFTGLRNTEGETRVDYEEIEVGPDRTKVNPILTWTEEEVFAYLKEEGVPLHPWYEMKFPDGKRYRSLGCERCTVPIFPDDLERSGRWVGTEKQGGECGIHTMSGRPLSVSPVD